MTEVPVELRSVRLFKASTKAEVGQLNVAVGVQQKVIRLYVAENIFTHCLNYVARPYMPVVHSKKTTNKLIICRNKYLVCF